MKTSAVLSRCRKYRYELRRVWDDTKPMVLFVCLNPSTADEKTDDNTSRVCINFAKRWGFGGLVMANLFAFRATKPKELRLTEDPIGPDNDAWLNKLQKEVGLVICAWGRAGRLLGRDEQVLSILKDPHCLVQGSKGDPLHPLYKSADLKPVPFKEARRRL